MNFALNQVSRGNFVWDYPETCLVTLCEDCHSKFHETYGFRSQEEHIAEQIQYCLWPGNEGNYQEITENFVIAIRDRDQAKLDALEAYVFSTITWEEYLRRTDGTA